MPRPRRLRHDAELSDRSVVKTAVAEVVLDDAARLLAGEYGIGVRRARDLIVLAVAAIEDAHA